MRGEAEAAEEVEEENPRRRIQVKRAMIRSTRH
jgi:hypothetical protein